MSNKLKSMFHSEIVHRMKKKIEIMVSNHFIMGIPFMIYIITRNQLNLPANLPYMVIRSPIPPPPPPRYIARNPEMVPVEKTPVVYWVFCHIPILARVLSFESFIHCHDCDSLTVRIEKATAYIIYFI